MVIKSCPLPMKDTETCVGSSLASYFVLFSLISFYFRWFRFISFSFRWFRFVSFGFCWFRFVSFRFVSFSLISFRFVSFRFYFVSHFIGTPFLTTLSYSSRSWIIVGVILKVFISTLCCCCSFQAYFCNGYTLLFFF